MQELRPKYYLTSKSPLKRKALAQFLACEDDEIISITNTEFELAEQPIGLGGAMAAKMRIDGAMDSVDLDSNYHVYSIESCIHVSHVTSTDILLMSERIYVVKQSLENITAAYYDSPSATINPAHFADYSQNHTEKAFGGYNSTFGEYMVANGFAETNDPKDWYGHRQNDLAKALEQLLDNVEFDNTTKWCYLDYFKDWPKVGVYFTSLTTLFSMSHGAYMLVDLMCKNLTAINVDYVIGLETRGIHLGALIARKLGVGFQMCRKAGKLPHKKLARTHYSTEYSKDAMELASIPALKRARNILIVDDVIATGGSILAVAQCIRHIVGQKTNIKCVAPIMIPELRKEANKKFADAGIQNFAK